MPDRVRVTCGTNRQLAPNDKPQEVRKSPTSLIPWLNCWVEEQRENRGGPKKESLLENILILLKRIKATLTDKMSEH